MSLGLQESPLCILFVGSDAEQLETLQACVADLDAPANSHTATTGAEAVEVVESRDISCVVCRYDLAEEDGISVLSECLSVNPGLLTILVSEETSQSRIDRTYDAGIDEFVHYTSPAKRAVLRHHLASYLGETTTATRPPTTRHMEALASTTSDVIISIDEASRIQYANPAVSDLFGYEPDELLGEPLTVLMRDDLAVQHREKLHAYLQTGERTFDWQEVELTGTHKDGHEIPLSVSFSEFSVGSNRYFTGILRDIRDRKQLHAERDLYHETTQRILQADSFEDGLRIALDAIGSAMEWQYAEAWTRPSDEGVIERLPEAYVASDAPAPSTSSPTATLEPGEGFVGDIWDSLSPEWVDDSSEDDRFDRRASPSEAGFGATLGVPIVSSGTVVAVMVFFLGESRAPDEGMIDATTKVADDLARLMMRLQAETALREERSLKDRILETSPVGIMILDADDTFSYINERAAAILGIDDYEGPLTDADLSVDMLTFDEESAARDVRPHRRVIDEGESVSGEIHVDGDDRWLSVNGSPLYDDAGDVTAAVFTVQDVTERKERGRRLREYEAVMQTVSDGVYALDDEGRFVVVNDAYTDLIGYDREELIGRQASDVLDSRVIDRAQKLQEAIESNGVERATLEAVLSTDAGEDVPVEARISLFELDDGSIGRVGVVRDITERKRREERLAGLNEIGQSLTVAESADDVADIITDGAAERLGLPLATVEYYDDETGQLQQGPQTPELEALVGDDSVFSSEWDMVWEVYAQNEERVLDSITEDTALDADETPLESVILLPLGSHGVFIAGSTEPGAFTETDLTVARILGAHAVAALDRASREQELREKTARLEAQNDSLERLSRLNSVIRSLTQQLTAAATREEVESAVCEKLAGFDPYVFAWIGDQRAAEDDSTPRASAGDDAGYLEALAAAPDDVTGRDSPLTTAIRTGEPVVTNTLHTDPPLEPWRSEAIQRGYRASITIPLTFRETVYGTLTLFANETDVFDETEVAVLGELGDMVGYALNAIERKKALVSESAVELTFSVDDPSIPAIEFAAETHNEFEFDAVLEQSDGTLRAFFTVHGDNPELVYEYSSHIPTIDTVTLLTETDESCRYEAQITEESFLAELLSYGARPTMITAGKSGGEVTVQLPQTGDVRSFIRMFLTEYENAELIARTERDQPVQTVAEFESNYRDRLTERQLEVVKTAYFSGFFEWPRETSGAELASLLDVSQPTISRHIRTAERELFELLFGDDN